MSTTRLPWNERRRLIVDAASRLFATCGYEQTTVDDIAAAAGVTKPIVYRHFGPKKELHLALLALHRDALLATLAESMGQPRPLADRVELAADAWLGYVEQNAYAGAMLFRDTTGDPDVRAFYDEMQATARAAVAALIAAEPDSEVPEHLLEPLAELVRGALTSLALWWTKNRTLPRRDVVAIATNGIWAGLAEARKGSAWT